MKLITAFIKNERLKAVKQELYKAEVFRMTVSKVRGCGQQKGFTEIFRGVTTEVNLLPKLRIDLAVNEDFVDTTINAIIAGARTGEIGDGKIFVTDLLECIRIRTGEKGPIAIGGKSKHASNQQDAGDTKKT